MESVEPERTGRRRACRGLSFLLPILAVIVVNVLYGIAPILVRLYALGHSNPVFFSFLRVAFSIPLLFLASVVSEYGKLTKPKHRAEVLRLTVIGLFMVGSQITIALAAYYVQATIISIFQMVQPVFATLLSVVTRTEPPPRLRTVHGWGKVIAIALTVTGSVLIVTEAPAQAASATNSTSPGCTKNGHFSNTPSERVAGYVLLIVNVIALTSFIVLQKRLLYQNREYLRWKDRPVTMTAWAALLGFPVQLAFLPATKLVTSNRCGVDIGMWTMRGRSLWAVEYQVIFNATLCLLLTAWSITYLPPSIVTVWVPTQLITTSLLSFVTHDEMLNSVQYGCMVIIMSGFFLVVWARRKEEKARQGITQKDEQLLEEDNDDETALNEFALEPVGTDDFEPVLQGQLTFSNGNELETQHTVL